MSSNSARGRSGGRGLSRRRLLVGAGSAAVGSSLLGCAGTGRRPVESVGAPASLNGPGSKYVPSLAVAFVRRKAAYGMRWPGEIYDGEAALADYRQQIETTARQLGMTLDLRPVPIHSLAEADAWVTQQVQANKPDGLLVVLLDRQEHAWPTAGKAIESGIPTVVFAPVGAAFTTNTWKLAAETGWFICSTDDFSQVAYGMKMIQAHARLREMRYVVLKGDQRRDGSIKHIGTKLRIVPARDFLDEYNRTPLTEELRRTAAAYMKRAKRIVGPTRQDVYNGIKSCLVAQQILEREDGDAITMDCLGALGRTKVSLPCIAWSRMNDMGIPAACEADLGACVTHALVQYLFDRPGFQQDPVPETARNCIIGAHCSCPTRLNGFGKPPEPFVLSHHHGMRDAVPVTQWRVGQRMTSADVLVSNKDDVPPEMIISAGTVVENVSVPPAGGCVVSVMVELDNVTDVLGYPGFHQIFFYGDRKKELTNYCRLFGIKPTVF